MIDYKITDDNWNPSEKLAISKGYKVVFDNKAFMGRYFIKDGKIWIHKIDALKNTLNIYDDDQLEEHGYDVYAYYAFH